MKDFQRTLEECLTRLSNGTATVDECLARYPEHAEELKPLLQTVFLLNRARNVAPSPTFNAYTRSAVIQYVRSHPRQTRNIIPLFQRTAFSFAMLVAALLVTGTVHAQSALPGDTFYAWKRTSEQVWRAVSLNPVSADLVLAGRRLDEWIAVADDPELSPSAKNNYLDAISKLESTKDVANLTHIVPVLQSQQQTLNDAGLSIPVLDNYLTDVVDLVPVQATPTEVSSTIFLSTPTYLAPTATGVPPTDVPSTATEAPPAATEIPPTATLIPPTATEIPPTATDVPPPTATDVPPTDVPTEIVPTDIPPTDVPPTDIPPTDIPPTDVPLP
jgi:hypothetical protein